MRARSASSGDVGTHGHYAHGLTGERRNWLSPPDLSGTGSRPGQMKEHGRKQETARHLEGLDHKWREDRRGLSLGL